MGPQRFAVGVVCVLAVALAQSAGAAAPRALRANSSVVATRSADAQRLLVDRLGRPLDGRGTTIAVIDTGVDPTHPAFRLPTGASKVVRSLTALPCIATQAISTAATDCVRDLPLTANSDVAAGGHGTFVGSVGVGNAYRLPDGTYVGGQAPGARLVMISSTVALQGLYQAFAWVLQHHEHPCGAGVTSEICPPIRVLSLSWGANDPVLLALQDRLVSAGVVITWANGNTGGDGSRDSSNPANSTDTTPGVLSIAGYDDRGTGTRNGGVASTSSRGDAKHPQTWPDLAAPSVNVIAACRGYQAICDAVGAGPRNGPSASDIGTYWTGSGTSWAAPAVAGIVALLLQANPRLTPAQIDDVLKRTACKFRAGAPYHRLGRYTSSFDKGSGLADAYAAALAVGARPR